MIYLRGHHLNLLYGYIRLKETKNPDLREYRISLKNKSVIRNAIEDGHSVKHGLNIVDVINKAINPNERIFLTDTIDDICKTCNNKNKRECKEFIPYDVSTTCEDRATLHYYGLQRRKYISKTIIKKLNEKGRF